MSRSPDIVSGVPAWAHYRPATQPGISCSTCDYFVAGRCEMFDYTPVRSDYVCDRWEGMIEKDDEDLDSVAPMYTGIPPSGDPPDPLPKTLIDLIQALEPTQKSEKQGKLLLISHAKTRYNNPGQPHDLIQGWRRIPLDAKGRIQARKLGKLLKNQGVEKIYASDLPRAAQTADIAGRMADLPVNKDEKYRPWNMGTMAGHSSVSAEVKDQLKEHINNPDKPVPGGESFKAFQDRFLPALEELLKQVDNGHTIALVTHSRNLELTQGWIGGRDYRKKIDPKAIIKDRTDPATVLVIAQAKDGKMRMRQIANLTKGDTNPATLHLRVNGVSRAPGGMTSYRMVTRDGHYVGRTLPTRIRAKKGDVLKIQANDFLQSANGDLRWDNPHVVSHYSDAAHSLKDISALVVKDGASGPAGDIPAAGDMGASSAMPNGPTLDSVHIPVPLPDISIAYAPKKKLKYRVQKANKHQQLIYGVVLEPEVLDSQDDFMLPNQVERAAHTYMKKVARGKASVSKLQHRSRGFFKNKPSVVPVESFIAPVDFSYDGKEMVKKGTWVMVLHIEDPKIWDDVIAGKYTGLSIGGSGIRQELKVPPLEGGNGASYPVPADWFS